MTKITLVAGLATALALAVVGHGTACADGGPPLEGPLKDNFILLDEPAPAPAQAVTDADGRAVGVAEFRDRVLLINFWATWCAPCVREMPSLDRLQAKLGDVGLTVMAVSEDRKGAEKVMPFYREHGLQHLDVFLDPKGTFARAMEVRGLPSTILVDPQGRVIGRLEGPLEWDGPEAERLIRHFLPDPPLPG